MYGNLKIISFILLLCCLVQHVGGHETCDAEATDCQAPAHLDDANIEREPDGHYLEDSMYMYRKGK